MITGLRGSEQTVLAYLLANPTDSTPVDIYKGLQSQKSPLSLKSVYRAFEELAANPTVQEAGIKLHYRSERG